MDPSNTTPLLVAQRLTKRFGGLAAVNDVSLSLRRQQIHAVIGPNGAGKSTLTNLLSGDLPPTSGSVHLQQREVTGWAPERMVHAGLARSYQKTNIFAPLTVWDNVRLAAQSRRPKPWALLADASKIIATNDQTALAIEQSGLKDRFQNVAGTLSHGEQRQLEIAMVLATEPRIILLDEPLAGMGQSEARKMVDLIASLKKGRAVLVVEHDMDAVFELADRLTVMADGHVLASGLPQDVRVDPAVRLAYLGNEEDAA